MAAGTPTRPGIVSLAIKDEAGLHAAYMPFLKNGGIFVPTQRPYRIGEEVFLVLSLLDRPQKYQTLQDEIGQILHPAIERWIWGSIFQPQDQDGHPGKPLYFHLSIN